VKSFNFDHIEIKKEVNTIEKEIAELSAMNYLSKRWIF
jgi:hypothetical protein